jgi:subtilisin family serine protease
MVKGKLPEVVYAEVSPNSGGGTSLFDFQGPITSQNVQQFYSEPNIVNEAIQRLQAAGFDVLQTNNITINIAGPPKLYEKVFKTHLLTKEKPVIKPGAKADTATFIDADNSPIEQFVDVSKSALSDLLEGASLNEPMYPMSSPAFFPPSKSYWHLDVPAHVSVGLNADRAHRANFTGRGIKVVMVDSGWYRHPFFVSRGYRVNPTVLGPGTSNPDRDENGHGTGESANIFAVAPDVTLTMVKINFVNTVGAFNAAVALNPHIISCSWGSSIRLPPLPPGQVPMAAAIANAVSRGIIVVFSAGNGHWGFPGQHPDVISAGGAYMNPDGTFRASDYASGFASKIYRGRNCPDICGLVGLQPRAIYIMLPLEAGDAIDTDLSGGAHPNKDETANNDGWAAFSGTSAAAPQLAGICALIKQACPRLTPAQVRDILKNTARDVTTGNSNQMPPDYPAGNLATAGVDLATGHGLVDAFRAAMVARLRCLPLPVPIPTPGLVLPTPRTSPSSEEDIITEDDIRRMEDFILHS